MRLRTRLTLAFLLLALAPLCIIVPFAAVNLRDTLSGDLETRMQGSVAAASEALARSADEARRTVEALAQSAALEDAARERPGTGGPPMLGDLAGRLMRSSNLSVLSLLDAHGQTLSSGHLPARVGDVEAPLHALASRKGEAPVLVAVQVKDGPGLTRRPAYVLSRSVEGSEGRLVVAGGVQLDPPMATYLARLAGAEVDILFDGQSVAHEGETAGPPRRRSLVLSPDTTVVFSFDQRGLRAAQRGLARAVAGFVALGMLLALGLGVLIARRITRPVEALGEGARRVAQGDWSHEVTVPARGEVGALIQTFNEMTRALAQTTSRLIVSERIAAWQEIAKRLAHELKNPLTPIRMSLETLLAAHRQESPRFRALFAESAEPMLEEVDRLRRTVDAFSSFARLPKPQRVPMDLRPWVQQVLSLHASPRPGLLLEPQLAAELFVEGDRDQLTQVLVNLVKNADEAMPSGGRLWVRLYAEDAHAVVEVEDTGPGIPDEVRAQLFTPYFTQKTGGTGLGLAISARICQEHGGALEALRGAAGGALFRMTLPRRAEAPSS